MIPFSKKQPSTAPAPVKNPQDWWWRPGKVQSPAPGIIGLARKAATEAITLLENKNHVLPLAKGTNISIFGRIQVDYFFVGYGSGGDIRTPYRIGPLEALRRHPGITVNQDLSDIYENWSKENPPNHGGWGSWPTNHPEMPLTQDMVQTAANASDVAIVFIGRSAGEDRETTLTPGSWYLTEEEKHMLQLVTTTFDKTVVLINSGNIIDMSWVDDYKIDGLAYVWQGGMCAGAAIADILTGDQSPSGRLHASIANVYENYPGSEQFGQANKAVFVNYVEDIFVGYRYFETFAKNHVKYPFGYGLGYATFNIEETATTFEDGHIKTTVKVTNTSQDFSGKEVVQVYHGAPLGALDQPAKRLIAYAKTNNLAPGESETITLTFPVAQMASYDDSGATGHKSAWVLEAGDYPIYLGKNVAETTTIYTYQLPATTVVEQLEESLAIWPAENAFNRYSINRNSQNPDGTYALDKTTAKTPTRTIDLKAVIEENLTNNTPNLPYAKAELEGEKAPIQLIDVAMGKATMEDFLAQLTIEELAELTRGGGPMGHTAGNPGNAAIYAGHLPRLREFFGIPVVSTNDGPSGIRCAGTSSLCPIGTALACTWNEGIVEALYAGIGREMLKCGVDSLLAPGLNLQRNPLNGRNFEYFSEDPLLNGNMAASMCRGIQSEGVSPTPKHFAANNQETNRARGDSRVSERALRELYLRGFEIVVKTAGVTSVMSSYNMINGVWCPFSYQLQHRILRQQWGYEGIVMTDWWIKHDDDHTNAFYDPDFDTGHGDTRLGGNGYRVRGRVDLLMPGDQWHGTLVGHQAEKGYNWTETNPANAVKAGLLEVGELQIIAKNVLESAMRSARFRIDHGLELYNYGTPANMFTVAQPTQSNPLLTGIALDGKALANFEPNTPDYVLFTRTLDTLPTVTATGDYAVAIEQPAPGQPVATITVSAPDGGQSIYRIFWDNRAGMDSHEENPIFARATDVQINGESLAAFHWRIPAYTIATENPVITATVPEGLSYSVSHNANVYTLRIESDHQALEYKFTIGAEEAAPVITLGQSTQVNAAAHRFYQSHPAINPGFWNDVTQATADPLTPGGRHMAYLDAGRFMLYNVKVESPGWYKVRARYASGTGGAAQLSLNLILGTADTPTTRFIVTPTGGWGEHNPQDWEFSDTQRIYLEKGINKLTAMSGGGFNLNFLEFEAE